MSKQLTVTCDYCKKPIENPDPIRRFEVMDGDKVLATVTLSADTDLHPECRAGFLEGKMWRVATVAKNALSLSPTIEGIALAIAAHNGQATYRQIHQWLSDNGLPCTLPTVQCLLSRTLRFEKCGVKQWRDVEAGENQDEHAE